MSVVNLDRTQAPAPPDDARYAASSSAFTKWAMIAGPVPLTAGRRLRTLRGTVAEVLARAGADADSDPADSELADAHLRVVLDEAPRVGLADEVRAAVPQCVEVVLAARDDGGRATGREADPDRLRRTPHDLFTSYLDERDATDDRVVRLFDELVDELA